MTHVHTFHLFDDRKIIVCMSKSIENYLLLAAKLQVALILLIYTTS